MTDPTPDQIKLQALLEQIEQERAQAETRRKRWRVAIFALPALAVGLLGILLAVVCLPVKLVALLLESATQGLQALAQWMLGVRPNPVAETLPEGQNPRPGLETKPQAPPAPPALHKQALR
jgi:hypothetical protein